CLYREQAQLPQSFASSARPRCVSNTAQIKISESIRQPPGSKQEYAFISGYGNSRVEPAPNEIAAII
ncbi:hypothetical protein QCD79_31055, partial [Pseudomonas quasicaspiana]|nr:hypothetical protein [Pseudomonas quasicaspiana]